ncbi:putative papain-like cysteine peptidase superfamily [Helianthus annuus]|nr:putative papain-like cysteine peptidase superfamily [Helianthus annuus]
MTVDVHEAGMLGKRHHSGNLINGNRPSKGVLQKAAPASDGMVEDDDFVETVPKMLVPKHEKPKLIDRKKKGEINIGGEYPHKIRTRSSPKSLYEALQKLSTEQKDCVRHMGFGKMLSFTVDGIPGQLGHYVVDNLDTNRMCIKLERGSIDITKEAIHQLVGVPNGGVWMNNIDDKRADKAMSKLWRAHYPRDEVSPGDIAKRLETHKVADWMFRVDFLQLFSSIMINCQKNGKCKMCLLPYFTEERDISELDWCSLIYKTIAECKDDWVRDDRKSYFAGPLTILTLLYVDCTNCSGLPLERRKIALADWDMNKLKQRQHAEIQCGGFGRGETRKIFVECGAGTAQVSEAKSEGQVTEEHYIRMNQLGCRSAQVLGYVSKLNDLMSAMSRYKMEFEMVIKEALGSNPQNSDIINISSKYDDLFSVRPDGNKSNEVRNESISKGKELMGVDEEPLSQFWTDPTSFDNICKTVDSLVQKHLNSGNGFFDGTCEPSFSLGLTQGDVMCDADFITPTRGQHQSVESEDDDHIPLSVVMARLSKDAAKREKSKRITRVSNLLRSPYKNRVVDINNPEHKEEEKVWEYLWRISGEQGEVIFSTRDGRVGVRGLFESLQPNAVVENNVIDCWSIVLNHEEGARSPDSEYRLFIGCSVLLSELGVGFSRIEDNRAVAKIKRSIFLTVNGDKSLMNLATYDLVFFPIQLAMHYFLVCFDLKNPTIFVVDSIDMKTKKRLKKAERELDEKHVQDMNEKVLKVRHHFANYLQSVGHVKTSVIRAQTPKWVKLRWATYGNYVESGIYMMRHMETYMVKRERNFECGFALGGAKQKQQLLSLKKKYAAKILLSDANILRGDIAKVIEEQGTVK